MQIPEWEAFTQLLRLNDLYLSDLFAGSYFIAVILPDCYNIHAIYMTAAMMKAVSTSNTECCLMNMVDRIMETHSIRDAVWTAGFLRSFSLRITAKWVPSELYTWILGHRLVGVSV